MGTVLLIIGVVGLVLAWAWVLSRPLMRGVQGQSDYRDLPGPADTDGATPEGDLARRYGLTPSRWPLVRSVVAWRARPAVIQRRQLMLATMFSTFAAFFLAIALRGNFVFVFLAMLVVLAIHVSVASRRGAKIVAAQRAQAVAAARTRIRTRGMAIRAVRLSDGPIITAPGADDASVDGRPEAEPAEATTDHAPPDTGSDHSLDLDRLLAELETGDETDEIDTATPTGHDQPAVPRERPEPLPPDPELVSAFHRAEEMVSVLDEEADKTVGVTSFVSSLIDLEWGDATDAVHRAEGTGTDAEDTADAEDTPDAESAEVVPESAEPESGASEPVEADGTETGSSEPIFTVAAKDKPARSRKARPIYIESQLDGDDDHDRPKAVNHT